MEIKEQTLGTIELYDMSLKYTYKPPTFTSAESYTIDCNVSGTYKKFEFNSKKDSMYKIMDIITSFTRDQEFN